MLRQRVMVAVILLPIGIAAIMAGGWWFTSLIGLLLGIAAYEYVRLFQAGGYQPAGFLVVGGVLALVAARELSAFRAQVWLLPLLVLAAMAAHLWKYERGRDESGTDLGITIAGIAYIGLLGAFFISLRALPEGEWWILTVLPAVWLADSGAYFIGSAFGRHKMTPRLSPNKSWQGYFGGILTATLGTPLLVLLYYQLGLSREGVITLLGAALIGLVMGVIPTLGDLGESMIKRQMGVKDSGTILPGHGGIFDRIDSWLWAGVIGYFVILWLF
ncbi:MAG: phosphatidate cytidylyltransferase [Anaerolineae bacterium]|nr:phosphatidate cytidylyltransferase [Anaerolineae bacterium]